MPEKPLIRYQPDPRGEDVGGEFVDIDKFYYRKQIQGGFFPTLEGQSKYAHEMAVATAKDRARHELIKALRKEQQKLRNQSWTGMGDFSKQTLEEVYKNRTVDGVAGVKDDDIKL